jgi:cold shock protein
MARGRVKWFNKKKGFGFIIDPETSEDIFVHYSEIIGRGYRLLLENDEVEYELYKDEKGNKARGVRRVNSASDSEPPREYPIDGFSESA